MTTFLCQEHLDLTMSRSPRSVREAYKTNGKLVMDLSGVTIFEVVGKASCRVCTGLELRKSGRTNMCPNHLRQFYREQPMSELKDPAFTLQFSSFPEEPCVWCISGKPPEV